MTLMDRNSRSKIGGMTSSAPNTECRQRDLDFCLKRSDQHPADMAVLILGSLPGVEEVTIIHRNRLHIQYNLMETCLEELVEQLSKAGLCLADGLMGRISRALCFYTEDIQRQNLGLEPRYRAAFTRKIFIDRYQRLDHKCRDARPDVWREYH